jgi:hypothetical protein
MRQLVEAPTDTIITLEEFKADLSFEYNDDTRLEKVLKRASAEVERITNLKLREQTWQETLRHFPCFIEIAPVSEIEINYYNTDNELTELDEEEYYVIKSFYQCSLHAKTDWPDTYDRPDAVQITIVCKADPMPDDAKDLCSLFAVDGNELREGTIVGTIVAQNPRIDRLIKGLRKGYVF